MIDQWLKWKLNIGQIVPYLLIHDCCAPTLMLPLSNKVRITPYYARSKRDQLGKFTDSHLGFVTRAQKMKMQSNTFGKRLSLPMPILIWNLSRKFAVKVDFSSGGCQKLPNWVKITDQKNEKIKKLENGRYWTASWTATWTDSRVLEGTFSMYGHLKFI